MKSKSQARAFSLVELVIVVVIIGVIAAIAVPRISRGARGAADSALRGDLAALRNSIDLYAAEHAGEFPVLPEATFVAQLTTFSDVDGTTAAAKDPAATPPIIFGPYLRSIPTLPVAGEGATAGIRGDTTVAAAAALGVAWVYSETTGEITANTGTAEDESNTLYTDY